MKTFRLRALDTLFFRDGKPFSMGEETWAKGIFPPYPSTVHGMLRSVYFSDHLNQLSGANTPADPTTRLTIYGYLPSLNGAPAFPIPNDLYAIDKSKNQKALLFKFRESDAGGGIISSYKHAFVLETHGNVKIEELGGKALLRKEVFENYLNGKAGEYPFERITQYVEDEPKIGIGRDFNTRTASEGKLYRVSMQRPQGKEGEITFLVKFNGITLPEKGLSRFGAEIKAIEYENYSFPNISNPLDDNDTHFKIYLASPAVFEEGLYPGEWFKNHGLKLLAAASGRHQYIGGFDLSKQEPKEMRRAVPAGTVFYIEETGVKKAGSVKHLLHEGSIYNLAPSNNSYKEEYQKRGFGLTYLGKIN